MTTCTDLMCPVTRTGWDMDPFVVISFGKKVFRTRVIRHSLNPNWDEKLLFHVRRYEATFKGRCSLRSVRDGEGGAVRGSDVIGRIKVPTCGECHGWKRRIRALGEKLVSIFRHH